MILIILSSLVLIITILLYRILVSGEFLPLITRLVGRPRVEYPVTGKVSEGYEGVRSVFTEHFQRGKEVGASVVVFVKGECRVELYGGYQDFDLKIPYTESTLQLVFSCSKFMSSLVVAQLVDEGLLKYTDKVSDYWPEFGQFNKHNITIQELMRHEGGVTYFPDPQPTFSMLRNRLIRNELLCNIQRIPDRSYHAFSRGWIIDELCQRLTKLTLNEYYQSHFNSKFNLEFSLGLSQLDRKSRWYHYPYVDLLLNLSLPQWILGDRNPVGFNFKCLDEGQPLNKIFKLKEKLSGFENGRDLELSEIPSVNGFTNAMTLAKIASLTLTHHLLTPQGLELALSNPTTKYDHCLLQFTTLTNNGWGEFYPPGLRIRTPFYGWAGMGGSLIVFNLEYQFTFAYVMNGANILQLVGGRSLNLLVEAFHNHLDTL